MVRGAKLERDSISCPRPATSVRAHPHNSSSSSCSLLTAPSHTRSEGSPMLAGLPLSCRPGPAPTPQPAASPPPTTPACACCACYPRLVARHPWVILLIVFLISSAALVALIAIGDWPDFQTSPTDAFKTVDTPLSRRYEQLRQLQSHTSGYYELPDNATVKIRTRRSSRPASDSSQFCMSSRELLLHLAALSRLVVAVKAPRTDQLSFHVLENQCEMEARLRNLSGFTSNCDPMPRGDCCPLWSLPHAVARLAGRTGCAEMKEEDVELTRRLVTICLPEYRRQTRKECWLFADETCGLKKECQQRGDILYLLFYVLLPQSSLDVSDIRIPRSLVLLPVEIAKSSLPLYRQLRATDFFASSASVRIEGVYFGLAHLLIDEVLQRDSRWLALGAGAIFALVWASTGSLLVTAVAHLLMGLSLLLGYAVYTLLFQLRHFPFVNMMSAVLAIAIGADDVFIYSRVWHAAKSDRRDATLTRLVADSLRHAGVSILVTSLSTAAALFANACSRVVAVKCFAVYAGMVVLVNLLLVLACIPATWVLVERRSLWPCRAPPAWLARCQRAVYSRIFVHALPTLVVRFRVLWAALGFGLTVASLLIIFYRPGFAFSRSIQPVFFSGRHPSELYLRQQADLFDFERQFRRKHRFVLRIVWGAKPSDLRDPFAVDSVAPFVRDPDFNPDSFEAQRWLAKLCAELHTAPRAVYSDTSPIACPFTESVTSFATFASFHSCRNFTPPFTKHNRCCWRDHAFPYSRPDFHRCLRRYSEEYYKLNGPFKGPSGLRFPYTYPAPDSSAPLLAGLLLIIPTNVSRGAPYREISAWLDAVDAWWSSRIGTAPAGLRGGFVTSNLRMFDLQRDMATQLPLTVALSVGTAAGVSLLTSLNPLLAGLALLTVLSILAATVATVVLVGWALDIVEAVVMTLAVGLAVDYCLHYGVAYRAARLPSHHASPPGERRGRAREALISVASPIAAAALTTALAGVGMLPTQLLVYRQMALFLIVLMAWAWFFSTFVFVSLLAILGPSYACAQAVCPRLCREVVGACTCGLEHVDKTVYSEAELSTGTLRLDTLHAGPDDVDVQPATLRVSYSNHVLSSHLHAPATRPLANTLRETGNERTARLTASTNDIWVKRSGRREGGRTIPNSYESLSNV